MCMTGAAVRQMQPGHWVVPRSGMCAIFWCGVVFILSSIILLVTSKHKGRLYQSWGSVMLGCGCCLMLICIILCIHTYFVMNAVTRNRQLGLTDQKLELVPAAGARHLVSKHEEARKLLMDSPSTRPVNGYRESSRPAKSSSSERRATLSRIAAVDVDDSDSQTASSCPTSSSSTSTTPPGHLSPTAHHEAVIAAVGGTPSQFPVPVRSVTATCRVRPLAGNVDWRGSGQQAGISTSSPGAAVLSASVQRDQSGGTGPVSGVREHKPSVTVTPLTSRHWVVPPSRTVPHSYDDCVVSADTVTCDHDVAESKSTVYDNVHVHV